MDDDLICSCLILLCGKELSSSGQLVELSVTLYSFYTSITSDYIEMEVGGGREPQSGGFFYLYKLNTVRWSHFRPI